MYLQELSISKFQQIQTLSLNKMATSEDVGTGQVKWDKGHPIFLIFTIHTFLRTTSKK